jgi:hypothetical protein
MEYPCAFIQWYSSIGDEPCDKTGMWVVQRDSALPTEVIHIDSILRSVHLLSRAGHAFLPFKIQPHDALDAFQSFYVNKYADHHANEILQ